jgi:hypothetical protein
MVWVPTQIVSPLPVWCNSVNMVDNFIGLVLVLEKC